MAKKTPPLKVFAIPMIFGFELHPLILIGARPAPIVIAKMRTMNIHFVMVVADILYTPNLI